MYMWLVVLVVLLPVCKDFFVNHHTTCRSSSNIARAVCSVDDICKRMRNVSNCTSLDFW
jgi:hypothetical protein